MDATQVRDIWPQPANLSPKVGSAFLPGWLAGSVIILTRIRVGCVFAENVDTFTIGRFSRGAAAQSRRTACGFRGGPPPPQLNPERADPLRGPCRL